ncbi:MAG TPA: hypothetical protein O0X70_06095 [Methanocorpusculum sp.]|nr:hypothetical protein [Methanocorpusculum sp.]
MSLWKGFVEWFCGKESSVTTRQFSKMMERVSPEEIAEKKARHKKGGE